MKDRIVNALPLVIVALSIMIGVVRSEDYLSQQKMHKAITEMSHQR